MGVKEYRAEVGKRAALKEYQSKSNSLVDIKNILKKKGRPKKNQTTFCFYKLISKNIF